jgi:ADP-ribose pyrophosphatase
MDMKVTQITAIDKLNYLHAFEIKYMDKKGSPRTWELVSRHNIDRLSAEIFDEERFSDGTMIFATNREKTHVVLLREFRISAGHDIFMLPAGLSDGDEPVEVTSAREFKEETGMAFEFVSKAPPRYASVGITNERVEIAFGYYSGEPSTAFQSDNEAAEILFVDREMAIQILENEDVSVRSALLLEHFFNLNDFFMR